MTLFPPSPPGEGEAEDDPDELRHLIQLLSSTYGKRASTAYRLKKKNNSFRLKKNNSFRLKKNNSFRLKKNNSFRLKKRNNSFR